MALLDEFVENSGILKASNGLLNTVAFDALVQKHGAEVAKGYLKAIEELAQVMDGILTTKDGGYFVTATQATVYGKVCNLHDALYLFLEYQGVDRKCPIIRPVHTPRVQGW